MSLWFLYRARISGNLYPLEFISAECDSDAFIQSPQMTMDKCEACSRYGKSGSCPPNSPTFNTLTAGKPYACLLVFRSWSRFKPDSIRHARNTSIHWRFQDSIVSTMLDSVGRVASATVSGAYLGGGYCRGCPGQKCAAVSQQDLCRHPNRRVYSLESTGIDVVSTVERVLEMPIYWYSSIEKDIPYLAKVGALFSAVPHPWREVAKEALVASPFFAGTMQIEDRHRT